MSIRRAGLVAALAGVLLSLAASFAAAQEVVDPRDEDDKAPGVGDDCDLNPCFPEDSCVSTTGTTLCPIDEEDFDPSSRDASEGHEIVCTGDEGRKSDMVTCLGPRPDAPEVGEGQRITRVVEMGCDAPVPVADWGQAGLPELTINHNPLKRGLTGLDTWLWSTGEHEHDWVQQTSGEQGLDFYGNVGEVQPDGSILWGEEEVLLAEQRWGCFRRALFSAEVVAWDWWMHGPSHRHDGSVNDNPQTLTANSDRPGSTPDSEGDGSEASARIMMEWKGEWVIGLDATWQADWGGTHVQANPEVDYQVVEVRSELRPSP